MRFASWLVLVVGLGIVGCGDLSRAKVHGKITLDGKPIPRATVIFIASDNQSYLNAIGADGSYTVDRVPFGPVKVSIQQEAPRPSPKADPTKPVAGKKAMFEAKDVKRAEEAASAPEPPVTGPLVPPSYVDPEKSGLGFEVKQADQEWSVDLK